MAHGMANDILTLSAPTTRNNGMKFIHDIIKKI